MTRPTWQLALVMSAVAAAAGYYRAGAQDKPKSCNTLLHECEALLGNSGPKHPGGGTWLVGGGTMMKPDDVKNLEVLMNEAAKSLNVETPDLPSLPPRSTRVDASRHLEAVDYIAGVAREKRAAKRDASTGEDPP